MRIFAVAQMDLACGFAGQPGGNGRVVGRGARKRLAGQGAPLFNRQIAVALQGGQNGGIVRRIAQHNHIGMVFGRRAEHGGPADVHGFDGGGLFEGVEIDAYQVNGGNAEPGAGVGIGRDGAALQNAAVHLGMQRLDPAVQDFRMSGMRRYVRHGHAGFAQRCRRAAGGQEFDAETGQAPGQVRQPGFVGHTEKRALDFHGADCSTAPGK